MGYQEKIHNKQLLINSSKIQELEIMLTEQMKLIDEIKILLNPLKIILESAKELSKLIKDGALTFYLI